MTAERSWASAWPALAGPAFARSDAGTADLYRRALVIDGNLVPPIDGVGALSAEAVIAIRNSGLTAIKADLDGSETFDSAGEMIRDFQSAIAKTPRCWPRSGKLGTSVAASSSANLA